jgi:chromosome segregation protein
VLRLKKIEINGFKSFHDKAEIDFPGRIIGVVGPNGCGKSNICDAITWVLGEQSAKSLRSERMDDVIFNGSARRRPLGLAEVSLTLSDSDNGALEEHGGSVTITRRVYRDGEGEYRLNGKRARLKDIHEMLMDTGLGIKDYSVIQQGKIDLILSTRPQDRRKLIEEAAGITKYKARKRAAEMKLEETQTNLQRIEDLLAELERQCNSLKRQAARAERYKETEAKLIEARERLYAWGYRAQQLKLTEIGTRHEALVAAEGETAAKVGAAEAATLSLRHRLDEEAARISGHREEAGALRTSIATHEESYRSAERRIAECDDREVALTGRETALAAEEARFSAATDEAARFLAEEKERLAALRQDLEAAEAERREAEARSRVLDQEVEALRKELLALIGRAGEERNRAHQVEMNAERCRFQIQKLGEQTTRQEQIRAERVAALGQLREREDQLAETLAETVSALDAARAEKGALSAEKARLEEEGSKAKNAAWAAEHKIDSLTLLLTRKEKPFRDQADLLSSTGASVEGLFAEHLEAEPGSEELLDAALGELVDAPVVRDGGRGAELLAAASQVKGAPLRFVAADQPVDPDAISGIFGRSEILAEGAIPLAQRLHPRMGAPAGAAALVADCWLVPDLGTAASLARRFPSATFFTPDRCRVRGAVFEAPGTQPIEGPLSLRKEIHELEERRDYEKARAAEIAIEVATAAEKILLADESIQELGGRRTSLESSLALVANDRRRLDGERAQSEREIEVLKREAGVHIDELGRLEQEKNELERRLEDASRREGEIGQAISVRSGEAAAAREELIPRAARAATLRTETGVTEERVASLDRDYRVTGERRETAHGQREAVVRERSFLAETRTAASGEREQALYGLRDDLEDLDLITDLLVEEEEVLAEQKGRLETDEQALHEERLRLDGIRADRHQIEVDLASERAALDHLVESCGRDLKKTPSELADPGEAVEGEVEAVRSEAEAFSLALEKMGVVNLLALEEFREADERRTFLKTQRDDLVNSIASLRDTIRKINQTSAERFVEAFAAINVSFGGMFRELFRGGTAEMRLLDDTDPLDSGIEIVARPPGKNNQSILLLSGGEKALTAIALLMAIFRYKPSPFCILDEVDAPLDEPNIDRFGRIIQLMQNDTQFIIITHSKRTMEMADVLYGVTMEEAGCSKLVSVRLAGN